MSQPPVASSTPRSSLLRFLLPVLLVHALLLAGLPYWTAGTATPSRGVNVELAPIATGESPAIATPADTSPAPAAVAAPPVAPVAVEPATPKRRDSTPPALPPHTEIAQPVKTPAQASPSKRQASEVTTAAATDAPPVQSGTTDSTEEDWQPAYRSALRSALAREHHYPARARRFGLSGTARVAFVIARDGRFRDIHLAGSTGAALLDRTALETVRRLGRFRPLPPSYSGDGWAVSVPLVYRLD